MLDERWVFHENVEGCEAGPGVVRRVLAYSKDLMCVENTFSEGAVGNLHHHPHTQITYVAVSYTHLVWMTAASEPVLRRFRQRLSPFIRMTVSWCLWIWEAL